MYLRVLWRLDILSLGSVVLVVALAALLPPQLAATLLASELAFGLITVPRRCYRFDRTKDLQRADSDARFEDGLRVLQQLLDPDEAHAELLRSDASWFSGWWSEGISTSELGPANVVEYLSYIIFSGRLSDQTAQLLQISDTFISTVGLDIGQHHNPEATLLAHTEEPLKCRYRPLTFYLLTEAVAGWSHVQLTAFQGYSLAAKTHIATHYLKKAPAGVCLQPPIVFLHGIGLGLAPYTAFLRRLALQHPDRTIIAVQYRHVSMRLTLNIPTATEVADDVAAFLASQGFTSANIVAHSYGTLVASSLAKRHAALVSGLTLIDPVCFAMFLPHLVCNTLHFDAKLGAKKTRPKLLGAARGLSVRRLMKGLVLREMHCAAAMSRRFRWSELNLWTSEIPANTTIVLGGCDNMIPVSDIRQVLTSAAAAAKGIKVVYTLEHGHGAFLVDLDLQQNIIALDSLCPAADAGREEQGEDGADDSEGPWGSETRDPTLPCNNILPFNLGDVSLFKPLSLPGLRSSGHRELGPGSELGRMASKEFLSGHDDSRAAVKDPSQPPIRAARRLSFLRICNPFRLARVRVQPGRRHQNFCDAGKGPRRRLWIL